MTYYHVRITQASRPIQDEVRLDIEFEELGSRFLEPYRLGHPITIAGKSIPTEDIERIRISTTDKTSTHYRAEAEARRSAGGFAVSLPWHLAAIGRDVTDQLVTGPPGGNHSSPTAASHVPSGAPTDTTKVFVVHGRNPKARDAMFALLRSIGLRPLEWSEAVQETGSPIPYIGEILETAFATAQAVVVLFSPDDEARLRDTFHAKGEPPHETELTGQARPNVLFEAGMAIGRSEKRTVLVELGALRSFSDIAGRHTIRIDNTSQRRQELAQRLAVAGCRVNLDGTDWHTAGDFDAAINGSP